MTQRKIEKDFAESKNREICEAMLSFSYVGDDEDFRVTSFQKLLHLVLERK
jgi:hypothetical protein